MSAEAPKSGRAPNGLYKHAKRVVLSVIGGTIVLIGAALLLLPGPGLLVIALGLGVLAAEFAWARRLLKRIKAGASETVTRLSLPSWCRRRPNAASTGTRPDAPVATERRNVGSPLWNVREENGP